MYVNVAKLRGIMMEKGYTQESLSQAMGIDRSTLSRKFRTSGRDFTVGEVHKIISILGLTSTEAQQIFLF